MNKKIIALSIFTFGIITPLTMEGSYAHTKCKQKFPWGGWTEGCPHFHGNEGPEVIRKYNEVGRLIDQGYLSVEENARDVAEHFGVSNSRVDRAIELRRKKLIARDIVDDWIKKPWYVIRVRNQTDEKIEVKIRYKHRSGDWRNSFYDFAPFESAVVDLKTSNRYVYFSAKSSNGRWNKKKVNMGANINSYTYSFNP